MRRQSTESLNDAANGLDALSGAEAAGRLHLAQQRALDAVNTKLRRGYRAHQGEKLKRRRRSYRDYLATFCS